MIEILASQTDNMLSIAAHGKVCAEDYENVLIPALEKKLKTHPKLRFLYHLGDDFTGYTPMAVWDDAKLGIRHLTAFEKVAVVSDVPWVIHAVQFFRHFVPCPVMIFSNENLIEAKVWLNK